MTPPASAGLTFPALPAAVIAAPSYLPGLLEPGFFRPRSSMVENPVSLERRLGEVAGSIPAGGTAWFDKSLPCKECALMQGGVGIRGGRRRVGSCPINQAQKYADRPRDRPESITGATLPIGPPWGPAPLRAARCWQGIFQGPAGGLRPLYGEDKW